VYKSSEFAFDGTICGFVVSARTPTTEIANFVPPALVGSGYQI
jgi:hypothetical protein